MRNPIAHRATAGAAATVAALAVLSAPAALATASAAAPGAPRASGTIAWKPCPKNDPVEKNRLRTLQCATLRVPLDHARPRGPRITLALTRARHTAARSQGIVLLNRGGPGAHGRDMPLLLTKGMPHRVAAAYDWIGFDPRGVGASRPAMVCDPSFQDPGHPRADTTPANAAEERAWRARAAAYAADCARRYPRLLPHMGTADWVRDMDDIRAALGQRKINYLGYSYGSYLGTEYASRYPDRVRRMVLDSVVRPSGVWYDANIDQNVAFQKRIQTYFAWIARYDAVYHLGATEQEVAASYARARARLKAAPLNGRIGASELDDVFLSDGYGDYAWPVHAKILSAYLKGDPKPLAKAWSRPGFLDQNDYAVYSAVQCRDAAWPRAWRRWHDDSVRLYRAGYTFETWSNTWYNAPCASWRPPQGPAPRAGAPARLAPVLLVQGTEDAATPFNGAVETHRLLPGSRLLVQVGGGNHGVTLSGDRCVDGTVANYLLRGALPKPGATCKAPPPPTPDGPAKRVRPAPPGPVSAPVGTRF
ncbi:alpha/beta hydrolase [Actinomadura rupiterrae]|uniref:alpha/beta hydrolase n=1 Tax=Actinomadura rupiterrae TaxID=559627 RepID=UPI0020A3B699|nr:alpha/beta hydrolase [Actinomadura rupiterrae]MCP2339652.1 pimeloyl-ACP methyl ester carboxylesterase [Actinomadura rupiterrae]